MKISLGLFYLVMFLFLDKNGWIYHLHICRTDTPNWMGWNIYASNISWTSKHDTDFDNRNSDHSKYLRSASMHGRRMLWHIGLSLINLYHSQKRKSNSFSLQKWIFAFIFLEHRYYEIVPNNNRRNSLSYTWVYVVVFVY